MRIYPLDHATKVGAQYHADIHLRPCLLNAQKFLSDAVFIVMGKDKIPTKINILGETEHWVDGVKLLPPSGTPNPWALWTAQCKINAWWMVDYAFQMNSEHCTRFHEPPLPEYLVIQDWVARGNIVMKFPAPPSQPAPMASFPIVLPKEDLAKAIMGKSPIDVYRQFYAAQKGKVRMRWTGRTMPSFFDDIPF